MYGANPAGKKLRSLSDDSIKRRPGVALPLRAVLQTFPFLFFSETSDDGQFLHDAA